MYAFEIVGQSMGICETFYYQIIIMSDDDFVDYRAMCMFKFKDGDFSLFSSELTNNNELLAYPLSYNIYSYYATFPKMNC